MADAGNSRWHALVEAARIMFERDFPEEAAAEEAPVAAPPLPAPLMPQAPPAVPERTWMEAHAEMAGEEVVEIGSKRVQWSDIDRHQGRLLLTHEIEERVFEQANLDDKVAINSNNGLRVVVLDHLGGRHQMRCKYRRTQRGLVFNGGWMGFANGNLQVGDWLDIYVFRSGQGQGNLCFIFLPRRPIRND